MTKPPACKPIADETIDRVLLLLASGLPEATVAAACTDPQHKINIPPDQVDQVIQAARQKILAAADFNRQAELGLAITRLNDIYKRAMTVQDIKTAATAQKELNKLLSLYPAETAETPDEATAAEPTAAAGDLAVDIQELLSAIDSQLEPLLEPTDDAAATYADMIRQAAKTIRQLRKPQRKRKKPKTNARTKKTKRKGRRKATTNTPARNA